MAATAPVAARLSARDREDVARIERYMNAIKTLSASFVQETEQGALSSGRIYLSRPGRMRFDYAPPPPILMIADGSFFIYYDRDLKQVSYLPLSNTPLSFLVREQVALTGNELILTRLERGPQTLMLTLVDKRNPDQGALTLNFQDNPLQLAQWVLTDQQKNTTRVSLVDIQTGLALDPKLFIFRDPKTFGDHANDP